MEELSIKIEQLNQIDENWLLMVKEEWDSEIPAENKELARAFHEFFTEARNCCKEDEVSVTEFFRECFDHSADWILEEVRKSLYVFFSLSTFRTINSKNSELAERIIEYCFENVILRFDPQFAMAYEDFGYETVQEFVDTARCMDGLIEYYTVRHWTRNAVIRDLETETGLGVKTCEYIALKMEENYSMLQMNVMIDMLNE